MARRKNYGFERRQKETARRSRQEAKRERKTERDESGHSGPEMAEPQDTGGPPPGQWEWFSPSRGRVVITAARQRPTELPDDWIVLTETKDEDAAPESP
ncbi:MAG TPA: hypothetical protein VFL90_21620 [Methylomirabilota bacterium]|nr:hypothetical protein [Methylomirabilota bacterium]